MSRRKSKKSVLLVSQPEKPTLKLCIERLGDSVSYSVMTEHEAYGSDEDVRALDVMKAYGDRLERENVHHEKMYRNRLYDRGSAGDMVVDRIRVDAVCQPPVI